MKFPTVFSVIFLFATYQGSAVAEIIPAEIEPRVITNFKIGSDAVKFGSFEFIGGFEIISDNKLVGAMSGFRFMNNRTDFIGVTDTGFWFKGILQRDGRGVPLDMSSFVLSSIRDSQGHTSSIKRAFDAEGIALRGDQVFVSFEQNVRIDGYPVSNVLSAAVEQTVPIPIPAHEFRRNGSLEALAIAPSASPLNGAMITFSERSVDQNGNLLAAIVDGPMKGIFKVKRDAPFNITDADFLPNGDLLLLERRFNIVTGLGMRIRKINGELIKKDSLVDGEVLLDVGIGFQIDNMEGMSVTTDDQGEIFVTLISDDNHSLLQRSLLLEFKLVQ